MRIRFAGVLALTVLLFGFRWPVTNGRITSSFGEYRPDHFHDGMDLIASDYLTYPVADGELLYAWNRAAYPFDNYSGSGNYKVALHGDKASVYLHLDDDGSFDPVLSTAKPFARYANTGRSYGNHIHFSVLDVKTWASINPFTLMPPVEDTIAPTIGDMGFAIDGKVSVIRNKATVRLTQNRPLLISVFDEIKKGDRLGVYSLIAECNGKKSLEMTFDRFTPDKAGILAVRGAEFDSVYEKSFLRIGNIDWQNGENRIVITARDYAGNVSVKEFLLTVNREF
jgi:hypothetical protein